MHNCRYFALQHVHHQYTFFTYEWSYATSEYAELLLCSVFVQYCFVNLFSLLTIISWCKAVCLVSPRAYGFLLRSALTASWAFCLVSGVSAPAGKVLPLDAFPRMLYFFLQTHQSQSCMLPHRTPRSQKHENHSLCPHKMLRSSQTGMQSPWIPTISWATLLGSPFDALLRSWWFSIRLGGFEMLLLFCSRL